MQQLETLLAQLIDKKKRLDTLREQSPELAEALSLSDEHRGLMAELRAMCEEHKPAIVPYPVYPSRPVWESPAVYCATGTLLQIVK